MSIKTMIVCLTLLAIAVPGWAENAVQEVFPVTGLRLIDEAKDLDGKMVLMKGEVVGDLMARGPHVWFHVEDESVLMGVRAPKELVVNIKRPGDYSVHGDVVSVKGRFYRADPETGGETYIRAEEVTMIDPGYRTPHVVNPLKVKASLILSFLALAMLTLQWIVRKQRLANLER